MVQKVIKIGNAIGMVLPKEAARKTGIKAGDSVELREAANGRVVFEKIAADVTNDTVRPNVVSWTNDFIDKNRELLERLKDR